MGHFPNNTSAEDYSKKYCERCIHYIPLPDCPVLELHELWNYDAVGVNKDLIKEEGLEIFIPQGEGIVNEQCRMFYRDKGGRHGNK